VISLKRLIPKRKRTIVLILVGVVVVIVGGYWLYTNDRLGPLSPPKTDSQGRPEVKAEPIKDFQPTDTTQILPEGDGPEGVDNSSRMATGG